MDTASHIVSPEKCSVEEPRGCHFCQIHHAHDSLVDSIGRFTLAGLRVGERVFLLLSEVRHDDVLAWLRKTGMDVDAVRQSGRLSVTPTHEFRAQFLQEGVLDRDAFCRSFNDIFDLADRGEPIRLYGEVSNELWHEGDIETAVLLDRLVNKALNGGRVSLFCGYLLDGLDANSYSGALEDLCLVHHHLPETPEDAGLRAAVDKASTEVLGIPLSVSLSRATDGEGMWWQRLPLARRTLAWIRSNMPSSLVRVLRHARAHHAQSRSAQP